MQRYANDQAIGSKAKLGKILTFGGAGALLLVLVLSFKQETLTNSFLIITLIAMLLSQYGIFLTNRWGKHPRVDEIFDQALKGLDSQYTIFHYELGASHALITPSGLFALVPVILDGEITFDGTKWWQTRLRRGKERTRQVKNLTTDASIETHALEKKLQKKLPDQGVPVVEPILVFLHSDATVNAEKSPIIAVHVKKLKQIIRKLEKKHTIDQSRILQLADSLGFSN